MSLDQSALGSFGDLATALGLLADGEPNPSWFGDPVGGGEGPGGPLTPHGMKHLLADEDQREALVRFVDEILGPPDQREQGGQKWVPLFDESDPDVTVYAVVDDGPGTADAVHLGIGFTHTTSGGPPRVTTSIHVPLFRFAERGSTLPADGVGTPEWLLLGRDGGDIEIGVDATFTDAAPAPGEPSLGGLGATLRVPTDALDVGFAITLRDLQLPGAPSPRSFTLDVGSPEEVLEEVLDLASGLVRAQAEALGDLDVPELRAFAGLAGMLGLRDVPDLPPLPLADLPSQGLAALVGWARTVVQDDDARDAWLTQLGQLVGGTPDLARDAVTLDLDPLTLTIGVRVEEGAGGQPALVPWVEAALGTRTGAQARAVVDLFRADTGTGRCTAVPDVRLEAAFGTEAGGPALVTGTDPHVGGLRVGLGLPTPASGVTPTPLFRLTLHDVTLGEHHDVLDLSTPEAALDAAGSVVGGALTTALQQLGAVGDLVADLLGLDAPAGVPDISATDLLADPVAAVRGYWADLVADAAGLEETLSSLAEVLTGGAVALPGSGTRSDPWQVTLVGPLSLRLWREESAGRWTLHADLALSARVPVLAELTATTSATLGLLTLTPATGRVVVADGAMLAASLARTDGTRARIGVDDLALVADSVGVELVWQPAVGLTARLAADDLLLELDAPEVLGHPDVHVPIPLPEVGPDGRLGFPAPDWVAVERALAALVARFGSPEVDAVTELLGWVGTGPRLGLDVLLGADPAAGVEAWVAELLLDCSRVRAALGPVAGLLSGFSITSPLGDGTARSPYRCPVAGEPRAPGVAVWLDPGCPHPPERPSTQVTTLLEGEPPEPEAIAGLLRSSALPDVVELMVGRDSLADGLAQLTDRWRATDGLVGEPASLPTGVTPVTLPGLSYAELLARGRVGSLLAEALPAVPGAVVHVGCEATWAEASDGVTALDLTGPSTQPEELVAATGPGTWTVRVPLPVAAAAERPERGGVGEQAARIAALLADRTDPVTLAGYGAAGAAVVQAAAALTAAAPGLDLEVVTVGCPWGEVGTAALSGGLSGDALRLLSTLTRLGALDPDQAWPAELLAHECSPLQRVRLLVERGVRVVRSEGPPPTAGVAPGQSVTAIFGSLDKDALLHGVAAHVSDALEARFDAAVEAAQAESGSAEVTALHAGVDVPVVDLDLGGLLVGVGATFEVARIERADAGLSAGLARAVVVQLHLGVHDGWLVGGPGSGSDAGDLRWMSARVEVPLDGSPGASELVLHEVRALGVERERWVVRPGASVPDLVIGEVSAAASAAVPEIRLLVSSVADRLGAASAHLRLLLEALGLVRDGGLDPDALDRLLHDPAATLRTRVTARAADITGAVRALVPGAGGAGTALAWSVGPASVGLDLASGELVGSVSTAQPATPPAAEPADLLPLELSVVVGAAGATAQLAVGELDPTLGGVQVLLGASSAAGVTASLEWAAPGGAARPVPLWPAPDQDALADLAQVLLPALGIQGLATTVHDLASAQGRALLEQLYAVLGMLPAAAGGARRIALPIALVTDPAAWFAGLVRGEGLALGPAGVALLDAVAPLVAPERGADRGLPLVDGLRVDYVDDAGRLRLTVTAELEEEVGSGSAARTVSTSLTAGVVLALGLPPAPHVSAEVSVEGPGLRVRVDPDVRVDLLRDGGPPLPLYPDGPGIGDLADTAAGLLVPLVLDEVADLASSTGLRGDVGRLVVDLGDALALRVGGSFDETAIRGFAQDPAGVLIARLSALLGAAASALARALDPGGTLVRATPGTGFTTVGFGTQGTDGSEPVTLTLDTTGTLPAVVLTADWEIPEVGHVVLEALELSPAGVAVAARLGPFPVAAGPVSLRPMVEVRAGTRDPGDRMVGIGLALEDSGQRSVQLRWSLDASPPVLGAVTQAAAPGGADDVDEDLAPAWLLSLAVGLAGGILVDGLDDLLGARAARMLRGVVLTESAAATDLAVDPTFALDLLDPEALLHRIERLLWNTATDTTPLSLELGPVEIALAHTGSANDKQLGISLTLSGDGRFTLADGDVKVELDVDASWLDPAVTPGLTVYVVRGMRTPGSPDTYAFAFEPGVTVAGVGLRFTNAAGPLLNLGAVSLDGIAVRVYAEAVGAGVGGGAQLELTGLSFAPNGGSGTNPVASSILSDAGESSPSSRPAFSPAVAIQKHPGDDDVSFTVRAGRPPGPWWLVVQRQLGPLYLEQVGFNATEVDGTVSSISLLFDGRVEIFGLTAAVDQLSLTWLGGDFFDVRQWSVDLMGLAVSADMSGISLAGGILKTVDRVDDRDVTSYVGMLLGRFGIYGLSVFGGYTDDAGTPSFFVFGAFNGPIGGPPAFFVTGIGGGLGINRRLVIPSDPSEFPSYPFIYALDPYASVPEPMQALRDLNVFFGPERGTFWFAGGISFTCFSLVDGIAVLAVSFGNGLEINLMGLARLALPNPAAPLVSIELGLLARFSTREGLFMIRAALTDNSWLLYEDVRLTGGFAFVVWWKGPLAGQFVLTIGGYHPDFHRDGYPDVPRVGLSWQVSSQVSIKGGCYFALTSEALMTGVGVEAVADFGWAWARASFGADGLVYFDPFWFDVEVRATISAGVEIDTWLGTVSFSITTGCGVHVWGPDFSGEATVQVGPCSVTVPFGSNAQRPGIQQDWPGFVEKYLESSGEGVARGLTAMSGRGTLPSATGGDRSAPPPDGSREKPFEVFAEFELTVTTSLPTTSFAVGLASDVTTPVTLPDGASASLGLTPMGAVVHDSRLVLRLERLDQDEDEWVDDPTDLAQLAANLTGSGQRPEGSRLGWGSFPLGVWGPPDPPGTPAPALPSGDVLTTGNQVTLVAEAELPPPGPTVSYYTVDIGKGRRPLPLQAAMDRRDAILTRSEGVTLPSPTSTAAALTEARDLLFATPPRVVAGGPQANGRRSNLDRASYAGRVAAPPMFGTLADGLAAAHADNVLREEMDPPEAPVARVAQDPRVVGFLASGADLAARRTGTTVSETRLPRRPAPSSESVLARLGRHLPTQLDISVPPGRATAGTIAPATVPRTGASGTARSFALGVGPAATAVGGLTGFGGTGGRAGAPDGRTRSRRAAGATTTPTPLRAGDVVALHAPDHALDTDTATSRRPRLVVDGGSARITAVRGDGVVLADRLQSGEAPVEPGTAFLVAQAGGAVVPDEGLAGWHSRSQVISLGTGTALAAGCVLTLDNAGAAPTVTWCPAGEAVRGSDTVLTSFSGVGSETPVRCVVVVVEAADPEHVDDMGLRLLGAVRSRDRSGALLDPLLVVNGTQVAAVYAVDEVPDGQPGGSDTLPGAAAVAVRVATGSSWRLTGVLAGAEAADATAARLSRHGVAATTARLLAAPSGTGCTLTWRRGRTR